MSMDVAEHSDHALLVSVARRGRAGLRTVYLRHGGAVYSAARALCGAEDAEAVTVDVFVELYRCPEAVDLDRGSLRLHLLRSVYRRRQASSLLGGCSSAEAIAVALARFGACSYGDAARFLEADNASVRTSIRAGLNRMQAWRGTAPAGSDGDETAAGRVAVAG